MPETSPEPEAGSVPAPASPAEAGPAPAAEPRPVLRWFNTELAWPLAVAAGFVGTLLGLSSGLTGAGAVLALAAFLPLHLGLLRRERRILVALCGCAWLVAVSAAIVGSGLEHAPEDVLAQWPFGAQLSAALERPDATLARDLVGALLLLGAMRIGRGSLGLFLCVLLGGAAVAGRLAGLDLPTGGEDWNPAAVVLAAWPPHLLLALCGAIVAGAVLADGRAVLPLSVLGEDRRHVLAAGAGILVMGLAIGVLLG